MRTQNKIIRGYVAIQRQILTKLNDTEDFIENVGLSRSKVYFKIGGF